MSRFAITGMLVQGDPHKAGQQRKDNAGVLKFRKDGQPDCPFYVAIAVPKDPAKRFVIPGTPTYDSQRAILDADARAAWPQFFGQRPQGLQFDASLPADCINPKFANKIIDGDGFDENGTPNANKDGWAGCWILKFSNGYAPKVSEWTDSGWVETIHTGRTIKPGNIITVSGDCQSNQSTQSPGMYMNMDNVSYEDVGREGNIVVASGGVDATTALGTRGAGATPPNGQSQGNAGAGSSSGGHAHGTGGSTTASGYSGYREDAAPPPPEDAPPPPSGPQMTAAATTSYDAYIKAGWSDAQLRAKGLMV